MLHNIANKNILQMWQHKGYLSRGSFNEEQLLHEGSSGRFFKNQRFMPNPIELNQ